jgi:hypothetical protein
MSSEQDGIDEAADAWRARKGSDPFGSPRHWPDPGDPPEGATAAMRSRYANVQYLVGALRDYASSYYSSNWEYAAGYRAGMRRAAQLLVNWVQEKKLWDR